MCFLGAGGMSFTPPPLPPAPPPAANEVDPAVQRARDAERRKAAAMAGYGSTIRTSGLGLATPAPNTTAGFKALLGA
jgi:hypothetical protein